MKKLFAVLILISQTHFAFSQSNYKPGTVIFTTGDTINGLIESKSLKKMGQICQFKKSKDSKPTKYSPDQLNQFYFSDGKHFISKSVVLENIEKGVFLEYLVNGITDLYYLKTKDREYFFLEKEGEIIELKNTEESREINNTEYLRDRKEYVGTLMYYYQDAEDLHSKIPKLSYNHKSLIEITKDYHEEVCEEYECIIYERDTKSKFYLGPYVAYHILQIKNRGEKIGDYNGFAFGLSFLFSNIFGISENTAFSIMPNITKMTYPNEYIRDYTFLTIPFKVAIHFGAKDNAPFAELGINNYFAIEKKVNDPRYAYGSNLGSVISAPTYVNQNRRNYRMTPVIGIGYKIQHKLIDYRFSANYEFMSISNSLEDDRDKFNALTFNLAVNFQLNKNKQ